MSLPNPDSVVTEERLSEFYAGIRPYLGGMPDILANKFNKSDLYSTDEQLIGRWIDGKPLYQKVVDLGSSIAVNNVFPWTKTSFSTSGIDMFVYAVASDTNGSCFPVLVTKSDGVLAMMAARDGSQIDVRYVTIRYTKTNDSAVAIGSDTDYSTTEKIVGTWIDGKPIYQKTISGLSVATTWNAQMFAYAEVSPLVSDIDNVIDACGLGIEPNSNKKAYMSSIDIQVKNDAWQLQIVNNYVINTITIRYTKTS